MRIIAGTWRSRRLVRPACARTRPISDRVKGAVFSMLGSYFDTPGALPPVRVADAFAGSGSMGLEALSRGAKRCWFFERVPEALEALERNRAALEAGERSEVITADAWLAAVLAPDGDPFELILLDPPYRDSSDASETGCVHRFLARVAQLADNRPLVVLHHPAKVRYPCSAVAGWRTIRERTFGTSAITLFAR